ERGQPLRLGRVVVPKPGSQEGRRGLAQALPPGGPPARDPARELDREDQIPGPGQRGQVVVQGLGNEVDRQARPRERRYATAGELLHRGGESGDPLPLAGGGRLPRGPWHLVRVVPEIDLAEFRPCLLRLAEFRAGVALRRQDGPGRFGVRVVIPPGPEEGGG